MHFGMITKIAPADETLVAYVALKLRRYVCLVHLVLVPFQITLQRVHLIADIAGERFQVAALVVLQVGVRHEKFVALVAGERIVTLVQLSAMHGQRGLFDRGESTDLAREHYPTMDALVNGQPGQTFEGEVASLAFIWRQITVHHHVTLVVPLSAEIQRADDAESFSFVIVFLCRIYQSDIFMRFADSDWDPSALPR